MLEFTFRHGQSTKCLLCAWAHESLLLFFTTQACLDVEKYLRSEFDEIREKYPTSFPLTTQQWPTEAQFTKIADRSSGLFAFATAVIRFIDDMNYGNPVYKLQRVLIVIDSVRTEGQDNPFAALDALYMEIMSSIPPGLLPTLMTLLGHTLAFAFHIPSFSFNLSCNWLGISQADAYGALQKLHAVLSVPLPHKAGEKSLRTLHKSFADFLLDPSRSGPFLVSLSEKREKDLRRCSQILKDAHNMEERTIQISQINLSWPPGDKNDAVYRFEIFVEVLYALLQASEEPSPVITNDCVPPFEDLNIELLFSTSFDSRANYYDSRFPWKLLDDIHDCFILGDVGEHNVVRVVPISTLDLERVDMHVVCAASIDRQSYPQKSDDGDHVEGSNCEYLDRGHPEVVTVLGEFVDGDVGAGLWLPSNLGPEWEASLVQHVATVVEKAPSLEVVLYGRGRNGSVLLCLDFKDDEWLVLASYKPFQDDRTS